MNRDTVEVLLANGCEVVTPRAQHCCGSLHAHNGELELARNDLAQTTTSMPCRPADRARRHHHQRRRLRLAPQTLRPPPRTTTRVYAAARQTLVRRNCTTSTNGSPRSASARPRPRSRNKRSPTTRPAIFATARKSPPAARSPRAHPRLKLVELPESTWCCGSAGIYNIIQPEMSQTLLDARWQIFATGALSSPPPTPAVVCNCRRAYAS